MVVVPCRASRSQLLCHVWCHIAVIVPHVVLSYHLCATYGVAVVVIVLYGVSQSLHRMGCHSYCTMWGVTVVALCGVLWSLHRMQCHSCCTTWGVVVVVPHGVS